MSVVEKPVEVQCTLSTVYNQWTQFETFPRFMEGVEEVRQMGDTHLHWRADIAGMEREWDAEITEQVPDRKIAWRSTTGPENAGTVTFQQVDPQRTRITLRMEYDPKGFVENAADMLGVIERRLEGDMKRFRDFIEKRGQETGAWRGDVRGGSVRDKPH